FTKVSDRPDDYFWNYGTGNHVTSYQWLISRDGSSTYGAANGVQLAGPKGFLNKITRPFTNSFSIANTEMVTDIIISTPNGNLSDTFMGVTTTIPEVIAAGGMNANHMKGRTAAGANILFMDGHVEWRNLRQMSVPAWGSWSQSRWN